MLIFGFDYDGCITNEQDAFFNFAKELKAKGHQVYIVTMRYPSECIDIPKRWIDLIDGLYPTSRKAKKPFMEKRGIDIHIWIDDNPNAVYLDASQIWPSPSPEGTVVDVDHSKEP